MSDVGTLPDLAARRLGGMVLLANDEFFAPKENLLEPADPVFDPDRYTDRGKEMDGWETRRRREPGHDWCIVRLGIPGIVRGVVVEPQPPFRTEPARLDLAEGEQGAHDVAAPLGDPAEAVEPGPSREVEDDGLDVVVERVRSGNEARASALAALFEELVPRVPPGLLDADVHLPGDARHVRAAADERDAEAVADLLALEQFLVGLLALPVVQVSQPDSAALPVRRLSDIGGEFPAWAGKSCAAMSSGSFFRRPLCNCFGGEGKLMA